MPYIRTLVSNNLPNPLKRMGNTFIKCSHRTKPTGRHMGFIYKLDKYTVYVAIDHQDSAALFMLCDLDVAKSSFCAIDAEQWAMAVEKLGAHEVRWFGDATGYNPETLARNHEHDHGHWVARPVIRDDGTIDASRIRLGVKIIDPEVSMLEDQARYADKWVDRQAAERKLMDHPEVTIDPPIKWLAECGPADVIQTALDLGIHHIGPQKKDPSANVVYTSSPDEQPNVYTLYGSPGLAVSAKSIDYRGNMIIVAAKSIKQAYYFAGQNIWFDGSSGILGASTKNKPWKWHDGTETWNPPVGHGKVKRLPKSYLNSLKERQREPDTVRIDETGITNIWY